MQVQSVGCLLRRSIGVRGCSRTDVGIVTQIVTRAAQAGRRSVAGCCFCDANCNRRRLTSASLLARCLCLKRYLTVVEPPEWISLWKEHLPLLVGAASTIFVALRILSVANFNPETAYALLQTAGTAQVILGAILAAVDIFLAIFATLFITPSISCAQRIRR
jgi:hypothetical protein